MIIIQLLINGIIAGSIYALIAIGFTVIYRTVRFFHFAHGVVYTAGAYIAFSVVSFQLSVFGFQSSVIMWVLVFAAGVVGAGVLGVVIDRTIYFPLRKKKASNLIFLLASFGVFIFLQNLIQLIYGAQIQTIRTGPIKEGHQLSVFGYQLGAVITNIQIIILVVSGLLAVILFLFIKYAKIGKAMRAVADNSIAASTVGINPERIILISFAIGSALAGAAGILISFETNIEPTMGFNALLKGIIASIVGGIGSLPGAVLGGFFLGLAENLGIWKISAGWKDSIAFAILIIFLIIKPSGIMGKKTGKEQI
jgi:branched-chain amino acid transport system permease protein